MDTEIMLSGLYNVVHIPFLLRRDDAPDRFWPDSESCRRLSELAPAELFSGDARCVFAADGQLIFGSLALNGGFIVFGPVACAPCDEATARRIRAAFGSNPPETRTVISFFSCYPCYSMLRMADLVDYVSYTLKGESAGIRRRITDTVLNTDADVGEEVGVAYHDTQEAEALLISCIEHGLPDALSGLSENTYMGNLGKLASDSVRDAKNMGIVCAALASRAAVRGGLDYDRAMTISDRYINAIEQLYDTTHISALYLGMFTEYAVLVRQCRLGAAGDSPLALKISSFISQNSDRLPTGGDIARFCGMDRSYLCRRFKKETGQTLREYVNGLKISEAQRLLASTDTAVVDIAMLLGYSSQSVFQTAFKRACAITPLRYRRREREGGRAAVTK